MSRFVLGALILLCGACASPPAPTDVTLYRNARVWTAVEGARDAEAFVVCDGAIAFVGGMEEAAAAAGASAATVDLDGAFVMPGFIETHSHFIQGGFQLSRLDLRGVDAKGAFQDAIQAQAEKVPNGVWILGGSWDHTLWGGDLPTRDWIDAVAPEHPVFLARVDRHMAVANSAALALAGIDPATASPEGGEILKDAEGRPTGVLRDNAMLLVAAAIPPPGDAEFDAALQAAQDYAASLGVTMAVDLQTFDELDAYRRAMAVDAMRLRAYVGTPINRWRRLADLVAEEGRGDAMVQWGAVKGYGDGSLGARTALLHEPYADDPNTRGLRVTPGPVLADQIQKAAAAGLAVHVHAIGDAANDWLLDVYEEARADHPNARLLIEHSQHLTDDAVIRFAALDVVAAMQPAHLVDDGRWAGLRLGADRIDTTYRFRSLMDAGAPLIFGSDWPVATLDPRVGLFAAATRRTNDGANPGGWVPGEKITMEEAMRAYTVDAARALGREDLGELAPGRRADFVVLSADPRALAPEGVLGIRVLRTVVDGTEVFRAPNTDS